MQNSLIDFSSDTVLKGFRFHRLEVYNWGTFNKKVWKIEPRGFDSLLTGNIGSGKSTLVDAVLTLLVPPKKVVYNKAAGSEGRERTINSYVLGEYKNQRSEFNNNSSPVYLRDENDYTVLLARFYNSGFETGYTLAQVFTVRKGAVERFYVISKQDLTIKDDFQIKKDDGDVYSLKKRLKSLDQTEVFDSFKDYSSKYRYYFGIRSEKVMELFYQTVSMKSVGKLTEFMRNHMLEPSHVNERIGAIKSNYENLTKSHEAVQRAKRQLDQLAPLDRDINEYLTNLEKIEDLKKAIEIIPAFFAEKKIGLIKGDLQSLSYAREQVNHDIDDINLNLASLRRQETENQILINQDEAGQKIKQLETIIISLEKDKNDRKAHWDEYSRLCTELGFIDDPDMDEFKQALFKADNLKLTVEGELRAIESQRDDILEKSRKLKESHLIDKKELDSLISRKSKIPDYNMRIRDLILTELELEESDLPFVGELLQIRSDEREWEGAIERVLYNFGLSIIVAERFYNEVSSFVDKTNLKGKIVYYAVPRTTVQCKKKEMEKSSLINKVDIKSDSEFFTWISNELFDRFNYICCDSIEQFRREQKAITKSGQIKGGRGRHEKDDERNIRDQRYYILGWNNAEKIKKIKEDIASLVKRINDAEKEQKEIEQKKHSLELKRTNLHDFIKFRDYHEIDWKKCVNEIEKAKKDVEELRRSSDRLNTLKKEQEFLQTSIQNLDQDKSKLLNEIGRIDSRLSSHREDLRKCEQLLSASPLQENLGILGVIKGVIPDDKFVLKNIDAYQDGAGRALKRMFEESSSTGNRLRDGILSKMHKFKHDYPAETIEMAASIDSMVEYKKFYERIKTEDLPRYEDRFKKLLNEGTINDIALFKNELEVNSKQIEKNIRAINDSLKSIEYSSGTYIELLSERVHDVEIRAFQLQLRDCLEGTMGERNLYNEDKFNQVKKILDRFNSGDQVDINWTNKVTDVRNWYEFSAVEKYLADNNEKEFYRDSSGKSGGQKEKLAYTILASALAYQFGPAADTPKSKSFRFVMIDEAFGRGSDDSTRYGLDLFKKLDLQLLIITPLQKIHIIENYINCVHLVSNENGDNSMSRDISIQEYRETRLNNPNKGGRI